jgi:hypothetical protein
MHQPSVGKSIHDRFDKPIVSGNDVDFNDKTQRKLSGM